MHGRHIEFYKLRLIAIIILLVESNPKPSETPACVHMINYAGNVTENPVSSSPRPRLG